MSLIYLGNLSLSQALPGVTGLQVAGVNGILTAIDDIKSRIDALKNWRPLPVSLDVQLGLAQALVTMLELQIQLGILPPNIAQQIAQVAQLLQDLLAALQSVQVNLDICISFGGLLAAAGVHCYAYDGRVDGCGPEITSALATGFPVDGDGATHCNGIFLGTTIGASWAAMGQIFKVT